MIRLPKASMIVALTALFASPAFAATPLNAILSVDNAGTNGGGARVRVVHGSPDAPAVDVRVNGGLVFANLPFESITDYVEVPAGAYNVKVEPAGAGGAGPFVIDADVNLAAATDYTVIATDNLAEIFPTIGVDNNTAPPAGQAKVRFFHGSPDAPAVDITLADGTVLFGNVAFGDFGADYINVPTGTYDLEVRVAGTTTTVLTLPGLHFSAGKVYTAYATGEVADGFADRTLYVLDDRFRVDVNWTDFQNKTGFGRVNGFTSQSGFFTFFNPNVPELVVNVLDGRAINGNFWVYLGSATNVAFTVTVTDTVNNTTKTYTNALGNFASRGDIEAFPN